MIADLCKKHDVIVFADEVYEWMVYRGNKHIKMGELIFPDTESALIFAHSKLGYTFFVLNLAI